LLVPGILTTYIKIAVYRALVVR